MEPDSTGWPSLEGGQRRQPEQPAEQRRGGDAHPAVERHGHPAGGRQGSAAWRSNGAGHHKPAHPRGRRTDDGEADNQPGQERIQAGRAPRQEPGHARDPNRPLLPAYRPRLPGTPGTEGTQDHAGAQRSLVRRLQRLPDALRLHTIPLSESARPLHKGHNRVARSEWQPARRRGQGTHNPGPGDDREGHQRQVRKRQKPQGIQRGQHQVRHAGPAPPPGAKR